jgi:alkanesulfonate monooxygenase SsuD/methylene tetrahydromethanopterin reductase-like flavin-dependent oxidoreductase (luciferase family)
VVRLGVHLPQLVARPSRAAAETAVACAVAAERLGFDAVSVNDHVTYHSPWLDGPALLSAAAARTQRIGLATTVLIPALRGTAATAQLLRAVDLMSGFRLVAGVGAGSHRADHAASGSAFSRRGATLEAAVAGLRSHWEAEPPGLGERAGPPLWIASWGAPAALRRVARVGDGWVASALAGGPAEFARHWAQVRELRAGYGHDPDGFGNLVATLFVYVADDRRAAAAIVGERLAPALGRTPEELTPRCALGTPEQCAEHIRAFAAAGAQQVHLWPAADPLEQLEAIAAHVRPLLA